MQCYATPRWCECDLVLVSFMCVRGGSGAGEAAAVVAVVVGDSSVISDWNGVEARLLIMQPGLIMGYIRGGVSTVPLSIVGK